MEGTVDEGNFPMNMEEYQESEPTRNRGSLNGEKRDEVDQQVRRSARDKTTIGREEFMIEDVDAYDIFKEIVEKELHRSIPFRCDGSFDERCA